MRKGYIRLAVRSLRTSKARSFLTLVGIIIGVVAVICVICIGQGVKQQVASQVGQYGDDTLIIEPKSLAEGSSLGGGLPTSASSLLSARDAATVAGSNGITRSAPLAIIAGQATGDQKVSDPLVIATSDAFADIVKQPFAYGSFFSDDDQVPSVVLGSEIAKQLFDDTAPLGQSLDFRGQKYIVSGIFKPFAVTPLSPNANFNDALFIPYNNAASSNGGPLGIYQILAQAGSASAAESAGSDVQRHIEVNHGGARDVSVLPATAATGGSDATLNLLTGLVSGAAAIALLVGGIGIMNIMLVSVTERMHEIGLRKAIGATNRQILGQFVAEAFVLSLTGAVIGIVISLAIIGELYTYSSLKPAFVWPAFVLAPLFSIVVGVFFGTIPAVKAARKDPIEALRHE